MGLAMPAAGRGSGNTPETNLMPTPEFQERQQAELAQFRARKARVLAALAAGRLPRGKAHRAIRALALAYKRRVRQIEREIQWKVRFRRANRNLARWEALNGLPGTTAAMTEAGRFHYWGFTRNEIKVWGRP